MIAQIVLNSITKATDKAYTYAVPDTLTFKISVGNRVSVPFGKGDKKTEGYVFGLVDEKPDAKLKYLLEIIDDEIYFDQSGVKLCEFIKHRYFCTYSEAIKLLIPSGVNAKYKKIISLLSEDEEFIKEHTEHSVVAEKIVDVLKESDEPLELNDLSAKVGRKSIKDVVDKLRELGILSVEYLKTDGMKTKTVSCAELTVDRLEAFSIVEKIGKRAPAQKALLETLCDYESIEVSKLLEMCSTTRNTLNALVEKGVVRIVQTPVITGVIDELSEIETRNVTLTCGQQNAVDTISPSIENGDTKTYLLHGITGSGKTEVYLGLIDKCISKGKTALFLVPEISLTPQMIDIVTKKFGDRVAVLHSSLTQRQRYDEWFRIKNGDADVVIGARSAIFAPLNNLGLIIIDEEHEQSYKSETNPRYHAGEIARYRAKNENAVLVFASATPSLESYYLAQNGRYQLIEMNSRVNNASLPDVDIIDMRAELKADNRSIFSDKLKNAIEDNLNNKKQTILFLNKRGFSSFVSCRNCGYVVECPNCNISLTYHKSNNSLICHYCDYKEKMPDVCPECGSKYIKLFGVGTQRVADEIEHLFPGARVLRMDSDTTSERDSHKKIVSDFRNGNADILVGTQMISKGLDFENVTLVGVLSADMSLFMDDFRAYERTFDLITQVCGRSGRGSEKGRAIIQTYNPQNEILYFSKNNDYKGFYESEIDVRGSLEYPPFCEMINITFSGEKERECENKIKDFYKKLVGMLKDEGYNEFIRVYPPSKAPMYRINGKYRNRIVIKATYNKKLYEVLHNLADKHYTSRTNVNLVIDVNPQNMY